MNVDDVMQMMGMLHPACDIIYLLYVNTNRAFRYRTFLK
jgi:hypothetical protein